MSVSEAVLMTVSEAAVVLNVSRQTIYRLIESGELPVLRVGFGPRSRIRIDPEVLAEMLARASSR